MSDPTGRAEGGPRFTNGPWETHWSADVTGYPVFSIHGLAGDQKRDVETLDANAQLIAAAPDLYAALHKLAYEQPTVEAIEQARAALARADGR